ncbi:hypothetical protein IVB69_00105 [Flavobacterium sp. J49]|uniref:hypothetical protein n=1 Tax=Flavobacterium sp. J49 TaxID=2718534 RepID=UPI00159343A2|nr:hypothetical protein [Flavobacterium sp. J49]MBF6639869.1 hypothetical protein [Flavobacterium sp. J49]NIC01114.1 hypothetical protein [Flavobacterium sp. J49]
MKAILFLTTLFIFSCQSKDKTDSVESKSTEVIETKIDNSNVIEKPETKTEVKDWQIGFGLTHDIDKDTIWKKPVRYYIENKNCSKVAIDFYFGKYRPTDEDKTEKLLGLVITENSELRPFYRWILNKTILIQDGALAEYTGIPARQYAEKFPSEFFEYMDFDKTNEKYTDWYNSIQYSGFYDMDDFENPKSIREELEKKMWKNCKNCNKATLVRIKKFALDCFPDSEKETK